jgi:membrane protein DedA with SNARE-associated domain
VFADAQSGIASERIYRSPALQSIAMPPLAETTEVARSLLDQYGLLALFAVFVLEGAMLLYFAPSESLVPAAVWLLGNSLTDYVVIVGVAVVGATIGQFLLFSAAKRGGREYLLEKRWFRVSEDRLERFDAWFHRYGRAGVAVSNTLLFTRGMLTVPAGFADLDDREFIALSALGTLSFETILATLTVLFPDLLTYVGL